MTKICVYLYQKIFIFLHTQKMEDKEQVTQYILQKFSEWYEEMKPNASSNDLSILKTLKLLFLASTINSHDAGQNLLDLYYDNYVAMPFGPVELDVYNYFLRSSEIIDKKSLKVNALCFSNNIENKSIIDDCILKLREKNQHLITLTASQLVELTHKYSCWINNYNKARAKNNYRGNISKEEIKNDEKFYFL